jgi:O-antigen/teichoic acid export membrane protein
MFVGAAFAPAVRILQLLALLLPFAALTVSVGFQWLLPLGRDHVVNRVILSCGVLNVFLGLLLAPKYGSIGVAGGVVACEAIVCAALITVVAKTAPFWGDSGSASEQCAPPQRYAPPRSTALADDEEQTARFTAS